MRFGSIVLAATCAIFVFSDRAESCSNWSQSYSGLEQNWPFEDKEIWYTESQGSRLIPLSWFNALPLAGSDVLLSDSANQATYSDQICPDTGLPIGFIVDDQPGFDPAIGLTCVACHTGTLDDGTYQFVVEGGATNLEFQRYTDDLFASVDAVFKDGGIVPGPIWTGFANSVLGSGHSEQDATELHVELRKWLQRRHKIQRSIQHGGDWGPGRTDAVAVILNTATVLSGVRAGTDLLPANAPVSIPHVWNAPQMRQVQWNGSSTKLVDIGLVDSLEMGAVVRNVAEVLGVFAEIEMTSDDLADTTRYPSLKSSIRLDGLVRLERSMETLPSPQWPLEWGGIDPTSPAYLRGQSLYKENCVGCHSLLDPNDLQSLVLSEPTIDAPFTRMVPVFDIEAPYAPIGLGTDPMMACNALTHTSWSGTFQNLHNSFGSFRRLAGDWDLTALAPEKFAKGTVTLRLIEELAMRMIYEKREQIKSLQKEDMTESASSFFGALIGGVFGGSTGTTVDPAGNVDVPEPGSHLATSLLHARQLCASALNKQAEQGLDISVPAYKARPLNGIFATAPYLHNGSVPTLDDLLQPASSRPDTFAVGRVYFDTDKVGLGSPKPGQELRQFRVKTDDGHVILGNFNGGHEYPPSFACASLPYSEQCEQDRAALIAYLKSL